LLPAEKSRRLVQRKGRVSLISSQRERRFWNVAHSGIGRIALGNLGLMFSVVMQSIRSQQGAVVGDVDGVEDAPGGEQEARVEFDAEADLERENEI
jgi:hypothetical protein